MRIGKITTPHGIIHTPAFIFCATKGAIKGVTMEDMRIEQSQIILANAYHLMPAVETIHSLGGFARMSGWQGPTLTDSGGYQIFSMGYGSVSEEIKGNRHFQNTKHNVKITEAGATFKQYTNGNLLFLSPEKSIEIQEKIGADLIVAFDECTPYHVDRNYTEESMRRSHRWEKRSLMHFNKLELQKNDETLPQALYGVVQGGVYEDLRHESCNFINNEDFFGQAIGGSLGATKVQMQSVVATTMQYLRKDKPIHLLGIGRIEDIFNGVELGIDTFDCVHPTRLARHGGALIKHGDADIDTSHINLRNHRFIADDTPIGKSCLCQTCRTYSRGYINHLLKNQELLAIVLIARHNVRFMNDLMAAVRQGITSNTLQQVKKMWLS
ncbi:MAG: tRNA guanosine(34) transglycosylase Tgt [Holosporales bacterium]|jgi:queuine tRNA-ribosyltransferase|nr:tRNA guanosine(34) transglycosylase Tgt [Holosporales bacterium]